MSLVSVLIVVLKWMSKEMTKMYDVILYTSIVFVCICAATIIRIGIDSVRMDEQTPYNRKDDDDKDD